MKTPEKMLQEQLSKMGAGSPTAGGGGGLIINGGGYTKDGKERFIPATGEMVYIFLNRLQQLETRLAQVERERDAAMDDARNGTMCDTCKHNNSKDYPNKPCYKCDEAFSYWEWRGCEETTKESSE